MNDACKIKTLTLSLNHFSEGKEKLEVMSNELSESSQDREMFGK